MADEYKMLDLTEFRDAGFLLEVNRRFFHPLGLALAVTRDEETGDVTGIAGVWDCRDDPEGCLFGAGELTAQDRARLTAIGKLRLSKISARKLRGCDDHGVQRIPRS